MVILVITENGRFRVQKNGTSDAQIQKRRPFFVANYPQKWWNRLSFHMNIITGRVLGKLKKIAIWYLGSLYIKTIGFWRPAHKKGFCILRNTLLNSTFSRQGLPWLVIVPSSDKEIILRHLQIPTKCTAWQRIVLMIWMITCVVRLVVVQKEIWYSKWNKFTEMAFPLHIHTGRSAPSRLGDPQCPWICHWGS